MNERIKEFAEQAGLGVIRNKGWHPLPIGSKHIERFAELVRQDEREACAEVCDVMATHPQYAESATTKLAAAAIKARSKHEL